MWKKILTNTFHSGISGKLMQKVNKKYSEERLEWKNILTNTFDSGISGKVHKKYSEERLVHKEKHPHKHF